MLHRPIEPATQRRRSLLLGFGQKLMLELPITPGVGAGPISLGATKQGARSLLDDLGYPLCAEHGNTDYFCENALQLEYDDGVIRFIGISEHPEISCLYGKQDVFDCDAVSLFNLFAVNEQEPPDASPGDTCFFPAQGLNLWEADEQYDRKGGYKRKVYAQVGVEIPTSG